MRLRRVSAVFADHHGGPYLANILKPILGRLVDADCLIGADLARRIHRYPFMHVVEGATLPRTRIEGRELINLGSNNYLGLSAEPRVIDASRRAIDEWGVGATGSRVLNGNLSLHLQLEEMLAAFFHKESALVFPTGYTANLGLLGSLLHRGDVAAVDSDVHASLIDGVLFSRAKLERLRHNDPGHLREVLRSHASRPTAVILDGVYSMRGDLAPLPEYADVCDEHGCTLVVDEAHGLGVLGPTGAGAAEHFGVLDRLDLITVTFSKSLGTCGGAVLGDRTTLEWLRHSARAFLFTASNTPGSLAAAIESLRILMEHPEMASTVRERTEFLRQRLVEQGLTIPPSETAVLTLEVGGDFRVMQAWQMLWNRGVFCNPVLSPAVPQGHGLLRLSVMRTHEDADLIEAARAVGAVRPILEPPLRPRVKPARVVTV